MESLIPPAGSGAPQGLFSNWPCLKDHRRWDFFFFKPLVVHVLSLEQNTMGIFSGSQMQSQPGPEERD